MDIKFIYQLVRINVVYFVALSGEQTKKDKATQRTFSLLYFFAGLVCGYLVGVLIGALTGSSIYSIVIFFILLAAYVLFAVALLSYSLDNEFVKIKSFAIGFLGLIIGIFSEWMLKRLEGHKTMVKLTVAYIFTYLIALVFFLIFVMLASI